MNELGRVLLGLILFGGITLLSAAEGVIHRIRGDSLSALLAETETLRQTWQEVHRRSGEFLAAITWGRVLLGSTGMFLAVKEGFPLGGAIALWYAGEVAGRKWASKEKVFLIRLTKGLTKVFPFSRWLGSWFGGSRSEDEIPLFPQPSQESEERAMIHRILDFPDTQVREIMVPRTDIVALEANASLAESWSQILESGYSRLPIYEGTMDSMVGVLHVKDLLGYRDGEEKRVREVMRRPVLFVPDSQRLNELFQQLRATRHHLAIVLDEFGQTAGLVTLEDLLEEIVGEIRDEFDTEEEPLLIAQPDGSYLVDGRMPLNELNERLGLTLPCERVTRLGGLLTEIRGRVPEVGDVIVLDDIRADILIADERRVFQVRLSRKEPQSSHVGIP